MPWVFVHQSLLPLMGGVAWALAALWAIAALAMCWGIRRGTRQAPPPPHWPAVDVLVAARNEEASIGRTLECLLGQDYPGSLCIWVGNDASTDATPALLAAWAARHPHRIRVVQIGHRVGSLMAKQNVLAQLFDRSTAPVVLLTDADVSLPPSWARALVAQLQANPNTGLVAGPTVVAGKGLFARFQTLDWLFGVSVIGGLAGWRLPLTVVGNNLAIRREAYNATGGYAQLPFSVTEDFLLFEHIRRAGWGWAWLLCPGARCHTRAVPSLGALLRQRKRWFVGGRGGPWYGVGILGLHTALYPAALGVGLAGGWLWAGCLLATKVGLDALLMAVAARRLGLGWGWVAAYGPYALWLPLQLGLLAAAFAWPGGVRWKERNL